MKIIVLLALIGAIVGVSNLSIRRQAKAAASPDAAAAEA
jgi:hypothetical protein